MALKVNKRDNTWLQLKCLISNNSKKHCQDMKVLLHPKNKKKEMKIN